ncbi:hypothetical protein ONE63_009948 [Megalurothrips usitatus]|uniref:Uncharacterized protein n=1 Tax=Megalurothrips usitatus TaxID=439358 RepID=A0AAV7XMT5_9NEOP|nr:hypothetical protein ONE63_009948 [Megalurothrips usitatus]
MIRPCRRGRHALRAGRRPCIYSARNVGNEVEQNNVFSLTTPCNGLSTARRRPAGPVGVTCEQNGVCLRCQCCRQRSDRVVLCLLQPPGPVSPQSVPGARSPLPSPPTPQSLERPPPPLHPHAHPHPLLGLSGLSMAVTTVTGPPPARSAASPPDSAHSASSRCYDSGAASPPESAGRTPAPPPGSAGPPGPGGPGGAAGSGRCCDTGRPIFTDPITGQTVCSCQYEMLSYQRLASAGAGLPLSMYSAPYPEGMAAYFPALGADQAPFYSAPVSTHTHTAIRHAGPAVFEHSTSVRAAAPLRPPHPLSPAESECNYSRF